MQHPIPCGSELAREGGVSDDTDVGCDGPFASKLAPTVICAEMQMLKQMQNPVGAGLPAIAEYQTTIVLNVKTPSRASPLPQ
ncbi:hypothetical protein PMO01_01650 [Pseudomonas moraviensis R28-S]|uniref:Uncharacterized protein n=1 Tax=Pseudomonas moraviensis R28-S TaxID=1395516 RepID=V8RE37_9PSED|nr:hypothetical protein PMO01_01650 [Pseudomonas moraviensis R28-S]